MYVIKKYINKTEKFIGVLFNSSQRSHLRFRNALPSCVVVRMKDVPKWYGDAGTILFFFSGVKLIQLVYILTLSLR